MKSAVAEPGSARAEDGFTIDAFHRGKYHLVQPAKGSHRSGTDAMLLAGAVPGKFAGRLVDLGAGAGAAGMAVAARCLAASAVLAENAPDMLDCAARSLRLPQNQWLSERICLLDADVTATGARRIASGLGDNEFDFAIFNPPFNAPADRASPHASRERAHVMQAGLFEQWMRTAAAIVRPGGSMALIARPASMADILAAMQGRFGAAEVKPVHPQADRPAIRIVVRALRGSRGALAIMPPLILHEHGSNRLAGEADEVNNGLRSLFGD